MQIRLLLFHLIELVQLRLEKERIAEQEVRVYVRRARIRKVGCGSGGRERRPHHVLVELQVAHTTMRFVRVSADADAHGGLSVSYAKRRRSEYV